MPVFSKNIWLVYYLVLLSSALVLAAISVSRWTSLKQFYETSQTGLASQWFSAFSSILEQQEAIITLTGESILRSPLPGDQSIQQKLDRLVEINPDFFSGFALIAPEGDVLEVSSNLDGTSYPNLLTILETQDSFQYALEAEKMILGRTYYAPRFVIPARKAIRDAQGKVLGVMTGALRLDATGSFFHKGRVLGSFNQISIVRSRDSFLQYATNGELIEDFHQQQANHELIQTLNAKFENHEAGGDNSERTGPTVINISYDTKSERGEVQGVAIYNPRYEFWLVSDIPSSFLVQRFLDIFFGYLAVMLVLQVCIFFLFRYVDHVERARQRELLFQANHDPLTRLPNRNFLLSRFGEWMREKDQFSLLFIDLDNFKGINDNFGHSVGDSILKELSVQFSKKFQKDDLLVRHGGDEFVLLTFDKDRPRSERKAANLVNEACNKVFAQGMSFHLTCSIGIAQFPEHGQELDALLKASDIAMYEAKKKKSSIDIFRPELEEAYLKRVRIEQSLKGAEERGEIHMMYQPQVDITGGLIGVEALVRWRHPEMGFIPPDQFIPIAENSGTMGPLGKFIIDRSLKEVLSLKQHLSKNLQLSINISPSQFSEKDFATSLINKIKEIGFPFDRLCLEITESQFIEDLESTTDALSLLTSAGIRVSLDDFGKGYSSLSILRELTIDELKIDKSFVRNILWDHAAFNMVKSIVNIGRIYNLRILAEGVETEEEMRTLIECGCDRFQGYLFARPMDITDLARQLESPFK